MKYVKSIESDLLKDGQFHIAKATFDENKMEFEILIQEFDNPNNCTKLIFKSVKHFITRFDSLADQVEFENEGAFNQNLIGIDQLDKGYLIKTDDREIEIETDIYPIKK